MDEITEITTLAPGTIRLTTESHSSVVLSPTPTTDRNDPLNWSKLRKWTNFSLAMAYILLTFVLIDIQFVAYTQYVDDLGMTESVYTTSLALNFSGMAVGCIFLIPWTHKYGRRPIYIFSLVVQLATAIWSATLTTNTELMASNFVMCFGAAVSETVVQMTIVDLFFINQYALVNGLFLLFQFSGAYLGLVAAGYVIDSQGWRWMWWWCAIFFGILLVLVLFFFEETIYTPAIDGQALGNPSIEVPEFQEGEDTKHSTSMRESMSLPRPLTTADDIVLQGTTNPLRKRLALVTYVPVSIRRHFYQPIVLLCTVPAVAYAAITYGALLTWYTVITTTSTQFMVEEPYNFSASALGLLNIAPFIGTVIGTAIISSLSDWLIIRLAARNGGIYEPEMRLYPAIPGAILVSAGFALFCFGLERQAAWPILALGWGINSVGLIICGDVALSYFMDAYKNIVGDGLIAVIFVRNAMSVVVLFSWVPWVNGMGYSGMYILCTVLSAVLGALPIFLIIWGKRARVFSAERYNYYALRQARQR